MSEDALPTQAIDAEVFLLGAVLSGYPDLDELLVTVRPEDFYRPLHEAAWSAVERIHRAGNRPEPVSMRLALQSERGFMATTLFDWMGACPLPASAPFYASQVAGAAGGRRLQRAGVRLQQLGADTDADNLEEQQELARKATDDACQKRGTTTNARSLAALLPDVIDTAQHGQTAVLGTPWPDLDRLIGGLAPGRLVVVGARPGGGKSLAGTNLALHFAHEHEHAVLVASLEMPESEVGQRLLAAHARVNLTDLQMGRVSEASWDKIAKRTSELEAMPITVDDSPDATVTAIRRAARDIQRRRDDLALIVVDYLQLVRPVGLPPRASRAEAVSQIARDLKLLARETGACVVAMAQVNREGARHADGGPRMEDIREGGAENDADVVILMAPDGDTGVLNVEVAKNRHGPKGHCALEMQGHYARLTSRGWSPTKGMTA